jgi:undecaprenyl-diphosphatase
LSIPAILGAVAMEGKDILHISQSPQVFPYALGMLTAFVSGYVAIIALIRVVIKRQLHWFAWYCWIVGIAVLGYSVW